MPFLKVCPGIKPLRTTGLNNYANAAIPCILLSPQVSHIEFETLPFEIRLLEGASHPKSSSGTERGKQAATSCLLQYNFDFVLTGQLAEPPLGNSRCNKYNC